MKTMPLPEIVATLIKVNGCSEAMASAFLNEFAQIIAEGLTEDGNVTVKGIGTFRLIDLGNETGVEFAPDKAMSEAVRLTNPMKMLQQMNRRRQPRKF